MVLCIPDLVQPHKVQEKTTLNVHSELQVTHDPVVFVVTTPKITLLKGPLEGTRYPSSTLLPFLFEGLLIKAGRYEKGGPCCLGFIGGPG